MFRSYLVSDEDKDTNQSKQKHETLQITEKNRKTEQNKRKDKLILRKLRTKNLDL